MQKKKKKLLLRIINCTRTDVLNSYIYTRTDLNAICMCFSMMHLQSQTAAPTGPHSSIHLRVRFHFHLM